MLVFFASYAQMNKFLSAWKVQTLLRAFWSYRFFYLQINDAHGQSRWSLLQRLKPLFEEPLARGQVNAVFRNFDLAVRTGRGAIMFAVCRGKASFLLRRIRE